MDSPLFLIAWCLVWLAWTPICLWHAFEGLRRRRVSIGVLTDIYSPAYDPLFYWYHIARRFAGVALGLAMLWLGDQMWRW
jgi:hypothetical protein